MKHVKKLSGVAFVLLLAAGCSGVDTGGSVEDLGEGEVSAVEADQDAADGTALEGSLAGSSEQAKEVAELARIDFADGNSVLFQELDGGILVMETGPELNPRHLVPSEGMSALAAFHALAPGREVPAALVQMHQRLYPEGSTLAADGAGAAAPVKLPDAAEPPMDQDLEHNGQFQQTAGSYPSSTFVANMCNFPNTSPNYRQVNNTVAHTQTTNSINTAYFAVASDIGIITARACSNGNCGPAITLQAGFHNSGFYDAGLKCEKSCVLFGLNCVTICSRKLVKFELKSGKVSSTVRFHECAAFTK